MKFFLIAATIVALLLIACDGSGGPAARTDAKDILVETPDSVESFPSRTPLIPKRSENTLVEAPEYTGVIFTEKNTSEYRPVFPSDITGFWEPSTDEVSRAEACTRDLLASVQQDPDDYRKEHAAFILENLENYRRQYLGIVVDGEKRIWTNAFFYEGNYPDWTSDLVIVLDGGNYYWDIEYVPSKDECARFHVHGEA
jgi:hypothetical protein